MLSDTGYDTVDDDDLDAVLVEDETGVERKLTQLAVFEIALSDPGPATEFARQATDMGYRVEVRAPDDGEGFFEISCSRAMAATDAEIARARRELEALAEELGCVVEEEDDA